MSKILITGGAGFIGANAAKRFVELGHHVSVLDNLCRRGTQTNLAWLRSCGLRDFFQCDVRDGELVRRVVAQAQPDVILHLAGQVAVTTSVQNPIEDFQVNALGTLNLLEAVRTNGAHPLVIYASTNKVYGGMEDIRIVERPGVCADEREGRYSYEDLPEGVAEDRQLDFHSPYGCSKGCADQYVHDYARIYGLPTVVFRQSCIYGPRQFGIEDQGWVAWFAISAVMGHHIRIYGDGKQVRDLLHVDDLIEAYQNAIRDPGRVAGRVFNIGGGMRRSLSIMGLVHLLERRLGRPIPISFHPWRPGDQPVYVSDIRKATLMMGWTPRIEVENGVLELTSWIENNRDVIALELAGLVSVKADDV